MYRTLTAIIGTGFLLPSLLYADTQYTFSGTPLVQEAERVFAQEVQARPSADRIRLASYNIQDFTDGRNDGKERTPERAEKQAQLAADLMGGIDPDILVLQEIENAAAIRMMNERLKNAYPLGFITRFGDTGSGYGKHNLAVLSRVPLEQVYEVDFGPLEGKGRPPRGLLRFTVDLGDDRRLLVYVVHLKSNWGKKARNVPKRRHALELLRADMEKLANAHPDTTWEVMVAGDVNVDPEARSFANDESLSPLDGWKDLWLGQPLEERITVPTRRGHRDLEFPPVTFDRLIVSPELTKAPWSAGRPGVVQRGVDGNVFTIPGDNDHHVSDHYPVYVDILLGPVNYGRSHGSADGGK